MSYEFLEKQIRELPEEAMPELSSFVMYMQYKFGRKSENGKPAVDMEKFRKDMAKSQAWAKTVGMTEQDIRDAIKEVRAEKRARA